MAYNVPPTFIAGATLTAAQLNTYLRDNFKALGDPWTSFTPTLANWTQGNGTLTGAYMQVGKFVQFRARFVVGSTSTMAGNVVFTLPVAAIGAANSLVGIVTLNDVSGSAFRHGFMRRGASSSIANPCLESGQVVNATNPWTWATGDIIDINGGYEAS